MINFKLNYLFKNKSSVLFIATCIALCIANSCKNDIKEIEALTGGRPDMSEDRAKGITAIYSKDGKLKMRIFGKDFVRNVAAKPSYIDLNGKLKIEFYNDSGIVDNILTADSCRYYEVQGNILIWDSVLIVRKKTGEHLFTSELVWNQSIQKFFTEKPVLITTETEVMHGNGMEANQDFSWYQITNPKGTVRVKKEELPQ